MAAPNRTLTLDDLADTSEVGDWKMHNLRMTCSHAASPGWLIVEDDMLTLTTAGLRAPQVAGLTRGEGGWSTHSTGTPKFGGLHLKPTSVGQP